MGVDVMIDVLIDGGDVMLEIERQGHISQTKFLLGLYMMTSELSSGRQLVGINNI
tara:strand:- start:118 stop:282 length:165 start_codon:yes stop_codon:yes gene_type:complete